MITKNSIYTLIKTLKNLVYSDDFKSRHCTEKAAFSRNRKLSFQDIVFFLLGLPRKSLPTELALYFEQKDFSISKQAFSKAGYQISEDAFQEIFQLTTDLYKFSRKPNTYGGYRIFAVDGSEISVPHNKNTEKSFGLFKSMHAQYPMGRLSALYDVTNDLIVDVQFTGITTGEREHAHNLLSSPALIRTGGYKNLILFDRGYPSRELIYELEERGFCYLIRCTHSFPGCVNECPDGDHTVTDNFKGKKTKLRVLKDTSGNEKHIFVSNLFGSRQDMAYHQNLYHRRWEIETKYGELKTRIRLENFSGKNPRAIYQELYAALFMSNVSALIKSVSEAEIRDSLKTEKHTYQLNRSYIIGIVSRGFRKLMLSHRYRKKLDGLVSQAQKVKSIIRPDRHFTRTTSHHKATNGFYIRINI